MRLKASIAAARLVSVFDVVGAGVGVFCMMVGNAVGARVGAAVFGAVVGAIVGTAVCVPQAASAMTEADRMKRYLNIGFITG
jgi:zinc transporter ZupT